MTRQTHKSWKVLETVTSHLKREGEGKILPLPMQDGQVSKSQVNLQTVYQHPFIIRVKILEDLILQSLEYEVATK